VIPAFSATQAFFFGTSVASPKRRFEGFEIPVFNDLGGRSARFQSVNDGEEWRVFTTMNRFDMNVYRALRHLKSGVVFSSPGSFPDPSAFPMTGITPALGQQNNLARGTLVIGAQDFQLILVNTYANTLAAGQPAVAAADLNTARGWSSCSIEAGEEDEETTRVEELGLAISCRNLFAPATRFFTCYTESTTAQPFIGAQQITLRPVS